jgi:2-methylisocitrate lyase-like PEP mutase family enzyme
MPMTLRSRFADLHRAGLFVMPNAWDVGSARILASLGFPVVATTSSGLAASLGRMDQRVGADELVEHVAAMVAAVDIPVSVDAEHCYADTPGGVAEVVERIAATGAAGVSIEDFDPSGGIFPLAAATARVAAAAEAADRHGLVLTARAENHLYGVDDLEDTISRLVAFCDAGAHVVYAPGLEDIGQITRLVTETGAPVNVLLRRHGPPIPELAEVGVRRVSTGGALAFAAYGALHSAATELLTSGTSTYIEHALPGHVRTRAFGGDG